jgi:hypothetical protein
MSDILYTIRYSQQSNFCEVKSDSYGLLLTVPEKGNISSSTTSQYKEI